MEKISTGISGLDEVLHGGVPEGATVLIAGRAGTGKTIFAHQMAFYNSSPERKVIYLTTLSEPLIKVMKYQQEFTFVDGIIYLYTDDKKQQKRFLRILKMRELQIGSTGVTMGASL